MKKYLLDTNILVRTITKDNELYYEKAISILLSIKDGLYKGVITPLILAEVMYVLTSKKHYGKERAYGIRALFGFFGIKNIIVEQKEIMERALLLFGKHQLLDFPDCYLLAKKQLGDFETITTFDKKLKNLC